jgi:hypothetical protein
MRQCLKCQLSHCRQGRENHYTVAVFEELYGNLWHLIEPAG